MADDELIVTIDKAFWPKGVVRGLTPLLRSLGDQHGNLVIAAVPSKHIMVKGPLNRIEEVKAPLRALIEEHFPDAPIPEALGGEAAQEEAPPKKASAAEQMQQKMAARREQMEAGDKAPAKVQQVEKAPAKVQQVKKEVKAVPAGPPSKAVAGRKYPRPAAMYSQDLLWECMRKNSSFLRKPNKELKRTFSAEPANLLGIHSQKFCGLAASEALNVRPLKVDKKESIQLLQSHATASRQSRPSSAQVTTGLSKCPKRGLASLDRQLAAKFYRRDLHALARAKYVKVQQSFKTKKRIVKSRRTKKN